MNKQTQYTQFLDDKFIPLEPKIKIALGIFIVVLPIVLFYFAFYQPKSTTLQTLIQQEEGLEKRVAEAKLQASKEEDFKELFAQTEKRFFETADMLPTEKEIPQLLKDISSLGQNAGLDFISFTPGGDADRDFYAEIPVDINVKGPYHNMGFFLDQVSKLNRIVTVSNIQMASPQKEAGEMLLSSTCKLVTYRFTNKPLNEE